MTSSKKSILLLPLCALIWTAAGQETSKTQEEQRVDTIRYGTDTEIAALIVALKTEKAEYLDEELIRIAGTTKNGTILSGVLGFFGERKKSGLELRAERILAEWDSEARATVEAAIAYIGSIGYSEAQGRIKEIIESKETKYTHLAVRALGMIGGGEGAGDNSEYLIALFDEGGTTDEARKEILLALGVLKSPQALAFLKSFVENTDNRAVQRMVALESIAKIRDGSGLPAVLKSLGDTDPNVRAVAVASLGPFSGDDVDEAILEAFRDSFYKTRLAACAAAKERKLAAAIPYLRYRVEFDEVPAVKDEALKALAGIGNEEAKDFIHGQFKNQRVADRIRILAAQLLADLDADAYCPEIIDEMDDAKAKKRTGLYNGFAKILSQAVARNLLDLARRFFSSSDIVEKNYALDMVRNNKFKDLEKEVRALAEDKNASLARKSKETLKAIGSE